MKLYRIERINQYQFSTVPVSIEDATGSEVDHEGLKEIKPADFFSTWTHDETTTYTDVSLIRTALMALFEAAKKNGKKAFTIDPVLEEVVRGQPLSYFIPNARRSGNRVTVSSPKPEDVNKPKVADFLLLVVWASSIINKAIHPARFEVKDSNYNKTATVDMLKKLVTFDQIVAAIRDNTWWSEKISDETINKMKTVWEKPECLVKTKKTVDQTA